MEKQRILSLCMASLLALSLMACNGPTDEQNSEQPTVSTQPTAEPTPTPPPIPYTDVAEDSPYYDAVVWAYKNGIATDGETFEPATPCTRGQVMTFLWRANGSPEPQATENPFNDVSPDAWYYKPALWAYENGVASGTAFNPGNPCTNAEALTFLWRAEGKPAASVYNSAVALAASGKYYERPAAWAETNGLFAGADFDPAASCSRADLMTYLYWAGEQRTISEEGQAAQAEFERIIYEAQLYEVHGSGLIYADYVDIDNNGKLELLTLGISGDTVAAAVYENIDGHAEKSCEKTFGTYGGDSFSLYRLDNQLYLCQNVFSGEIGETYDFCRIEKSAITFCEQASVFYREETPKADTAILQKYKEEKGLLRIDYNTISALNRGILPAPEEYPAARTQYRKARLEYLANYWASVDKTYTKTVQAEFEQIINESQLYEVHGSGLVYADYVDVEGNSKAGLLTVGIDGDAVTVAVYANRGGHAEKYCEQVFPFGSTCRLSLCTYDNHMCLHREIPLSHPDNVFYKIENGAFVFSDSVSADVGAEGVYYNISAEGDSTIISKAEYDAVMEKYGNQKDLLGYSYNGVSVLSRGLLPSPEEYAAAQAKQWETEREKVYAAVKNGDFSFFAGTYASEYGNSLVLDKNGVITGGHDFYTTSQKPISISVGGNGVIHCKIPAEKVLREYPDESTAYREPEEYYKIYPVGIDDEFNHGNLDKVRIEYAYILGSAEVEIYYRVS